MQVLQMAFKNVHLNVVTEDKTFYYVTADSLFKPEYTTIEKPASGLVQWVISSASKTMWAGEVH